MTRFFIGTAERFGIVAITIMGKSGSHFTQKDVF